MKKLIGLMATIILFSSSTTLAVFSFQEQKIEKSNTNLNGIIINLDDLKNIPSPTSLFVSNSSQVTYEEVQNALSPLVLKAVQSLSILAKLLDVKFEIYSDNIGTPFKILDLSVTSAVVYVKVTANVLSFLFVGASPYIKIILPVASDTRTNLNKVKSINSPSSVTAQSPSSVTYSELKEALNGVVLDTLASIIPTISKNDFSFDLYSNISDLEYKNINLSGRNNYVYLQIVANKVSNLIFGTSDYIKVLLPAIKANIGTVCEISSAPISVSAIDQTSVEKSEVLKAINSSVNMTISQLAPTAVIAEDYNYDIFSSASKDQYKNLNILGQTNTVFLDIESTNTSIFLTGSVMIEVLLVGTQTDLSSITNVTPPNFVDAANSKSVTETEIKEAMKKNILIEVQSLISQATINDFVFNIYSDDKGTSYNNIDLSNNSADVYIKIESIPNNLLLKGSTSYIKVTLPRIKNSLRSITSVSDASIFISSAVPTSVTEAEIRLVLDPLVSKAVNLINTKAELKTDYTYTLSNKINQSSYTNIDLSNSFFSTAKTVYIQINAAPNSTILMDSTDKIGVSIYGTKNDISKIKKIALPSPVIANNPKAVTKQELKTAISKQVFLAVSKLEPGVKESDFTFDLFAFNGTVYYPLDLSTHYGYAQLVITANTSSNVIFGSTSKILIVFSPIK